MYDKSPYYGVEALYKLLVGEYGISKEVVKTLILKYPPILN